MPGVLSTARHGGGGFWTGVRVFSTDFLAKRVRRLCVRIYTCVIRFLILLLFLPLSFLSFFLFFFYSIARSFLISRLSRRQNNCFNGNRFPIHITGMSFCTVFLLYRVAFFPYDTLFSFRNIRLSE